MASTDIEIVEKGIRPNVNLADWTDPEPGDDRYGPNQMVGAYNAGIVKGMENAFGSMQEWVRRTREQNAKKAALHTLSIITWLKERGFHPLSALLNETQFNAPEVLILLPTEEYVGPLMDGVYDYIAQRELEWREPDYAINFSLTYRGEILDRSLLKADGFIRYHMALEG